MELQATKIGPMALDCAGGSRVGRCIARFDRSAYVGFEGGIVWVVRDGLPIGPINAIVTVLPHPNEDVSIDARMARVWPPPIKAPVGRRLPCGIGLAELIERLGRGPGLTPSGDDFVTGYLMACHAADIEVDRQAVLTAARARTNAISFAHLRAAARGGGLEPFHFALNDLMRVEPSYLAPIARGRAVDDLAATLPGLGPALRIGGSSGRSVVAGMIACLSSLSSRVESD